MRIIHCAWAAALLSALAAGSCAKDTTGNGGTGTTESYNDKIDSYLASWKENPDRRSLIVRGPRQVGKTESILRFAKATT